MDVMKWLSRAFIVFMGLFLVFLVVMAITRAGTPSGSRALVQSITLLACLLLMGGWFAAARQRGRLRARRLRRANPGAEVAATRIILDGARYSRCVVVADARGVTFHLASGVRFEPWDRVASITHESRVDPITVAIKDDEPILLVPPGGALSRTGATGGT